MSYYPLPLREMPGGLSDEYAELFSDPWVARKLDRKRRLSELARYFNDYLSDLNFEGRRVVDIGCAAGELLEILRMHGADISGVDNIADSCTGMGKKYVRASQICCLRQGIPVEYCGFSNWLLNNMHNASREYLLINFRGSFSQCLEIFQQGPPHHETHDSKQLRWKVDYNSQIGILSTLNELKCLLSDDGVILISMNESSNHDQFDSMFKRCIENAKLTCSNPDRLVYKIKKKDSSGC